MEDKTEDEIEGKTEDEMEGKVKNGVFVSHGLARVAFVVFEC